MENQNPQTDKSHGANLFVLIEQYFPNDGKQEAILDIAIQSAKDIEGVQGLLMTKVLRPKTQTGPVCTVSTWQSESDFKIFMKSDAVKELYVSETMANTKAWTSNIDVQMFTLEDGWHQ
ncbi:MAG: antibiotic biosynthesis monooxygenase [FCB group bacterium]|nr:antibiotic biosynthesis monooxygenase [FCB group bacterium]